MLGWHVEQTPLAVIEWNTEGRVMSWNPAAERIFGYGAPEAIGQSILELVVPKDSNLRSQVAQIAEALLQDHGLSEIQHANIRKDGSPVICKWFNTPLKDDHGQVIGVASMAMALEFRMRTGEGQFRWVQGQGKPFYDANG